MKKYFSYLRHAQYISQSFTTCFNLFFPFPLKHTYALSSFMWLNTTRPISCLQLIKNYKRRYKVLINDKSYRENKSEMQVWLKKSINPDSRQKI